MTNITISDLNPADSDSYMRELSDEELNALAGGWIEELLAAIGVGVASIFTGVWIGMLFE